MGERSAQREIEDGGLTAVVDRLVALGREQDHVSVQDVQDALGERGFGPFLFVPAIIEISPLGAIPAVPTTLGAVVVLSAVQLLFGRKHFWLPRFINRRCMRGERVERAMSRIRRVAQWADRAVHPRLRWAAREPFIHIAAGLCIVLAATVPPLELVPFASSAPFVPIGLIGLGLMVRDGAAVLLASLIALGAFYFAYRVMF